MAPLAEVVTISKRKEGRKERLIPWTEFEPLLNQIRTLFNCNNDDALKTIGYAGASLISAWRRDGVPIIAKFSAQWHLHEVRSPKPRTSFDFDELSRIFAALNRIEIPADQRQAIIRKIAAVMIESTEL